VIPLLVPNNGGRSPSRLYKKKISLSFNRGVGAATCTLNWAHTNDKEEPHQSVVNLKKKSAEGHQKDINNKQREKLKR